LLKDIIGEVRRSKKEERRRGRRKKISIRIKSKSEKWFVYSLLNK
jgi:hypothetical protein